MLSIKILLCEWEYKISSLYTDVLPQTSAVSHNIQQVETATARDKKLVRNMKSSTKTNYILFIN